MTTPIILHNNSRCWARIDCKDGLCVQFYLEIKIEDSVQVRGFCRNCIFPAMVDFNKDPHITEIKVLNNDEYNVYNVIIQ